MAQDKKLLIGHDVGTGGTKSVLTDSSGRLIASSFNPYETSYPRPTWVEQDPLDWWRAACTGTRDVLEKAGTPPEEVAGVGFAGQMCGVVPVDASGKLTRMPIIWLDSRADEQARRMIRRFGGTRLMNLVAGAVPTGKDVVCEINWVQENEPEVYEKTSKFLDVTGYLVFKATGKMVIDHTGAGGTGLLDGKKRQWSKFLARLARVSLDKLPDVKGCTEIVGGLTADAAGEMGLAPGTPVIAGMADIPAAATGSGALCEGDAHVYLGTSSWLCISVEKPDNLGRYGIAAVASPDPAMNIMIGESETAGLCLEWFADNFATPEEKAAGVFASLDEAAAAIDPGSGRLIFFPWLFGERSPVGDTTVRSSFANLGLEHTRDHMLRSVYEGVAYNVRWLLDAAASKGFACDPLRAIGGGAKSDLWMQVMADVTGRRIEPVEEPQEAGGIGCALAVAVALGLFKDYKDIKEVVNVRRAFEPRLQYFKMYDELYDSFRAAYPALSKMGKKLNKPH